jgi:hypothetical protein
MGKQFNWMRYGIILLTAVVVLLFVRHREKQYESRDYPVFDFNKADVNSFKIEKGIEAAGFMREDTLWVFQEPDTGAVDQDKVDRFLETVTTMTRGNFIASNPEHYADFNLDEESAYRLRFFQADEVIGDLFVGFSVNSPTRDNIRYTHDPHVYQVDVKLTRQVRALPDTWRE